MLVATTTWTSAVESEVALEYFDPKGKGEQSKTLN